MYKQDLELNNLQWLICYKIQPNKTIIAITPRSTLTWRVQYMNQTELNSICTFYFSVYFQSFWRDVALEVTVSSVRVRM